MESSLPPTYRKKKSWAWLTMVLHLMHFCKSGQMQHESLFWGYSLKTVVKGNPPIGKISRSTLGPLLRGKRGCTSDYGPVYELWTAECLWTWSATLPWVCSLLACSLPCICENSSNHIHRMYAGPPGCLCQLRIPLMISTQLMIPGSREWTSCLALGWICSLLKIPSWPLSPTHALTEEVHTFLFVKCTSTKLISKEKNNVISSFLTFYFGKSLENI